MFLVLFFFQILLVTFRVFGLLDFRVLNGFGQDVREMPQKKARSSKRITQGEMSYRLHQASASQRPDSSLRLV